MKKEKPKIDKDDFIEFLANSSPEEINKFIEEKGKPHRPIWPVFILPSKK